MQSVARQHLKDAVTVDAVGRGVSEAATTVTHHAILSPQSPSARVATLADVIAVHGNQHAQVYATSKSYPSPSHSP